MPTLTQQLVLDAVVRKSQAGAFACDAVLIATLPPFVYPRGRVSNLRRDRRTSHLGADRRDSDVSDW
jgi:hypothetical protein